MDEKDELSFLYMAVYVDEQRKVSCELYQKPTDTKTCLNCRSCAQHKRNNLQSTIYGVFDLQAACVTLKKT